MENARVSAGTVNKQLGALQAIAGWAEQNGLIPEDTAWSNPFAKTKVREEQSERTSFETAELKVLFAAPVFTKHEYPQGARGPAAFWLPLLALFTGARQAELAGLTVGNIQADEERRQRALLIEAIDRRAQVEIDYGSAPARNCGIWPTAAIGASPPVRIPIQRGEFLPFDVDVALVDLGSEEA